MRLCIWGDRHSESGYSWLRLSWGVCRACKAGIMAQSTADVEICSEEMGWTEPMICSILHGHVYGCNAQSALRSLGNSQIKDGRVQKSSRKPSGNFCVLTSLFSKLTNTLERWQADITDFWENSVPHCGLTKSHRLLKVIDLPRQEYQRPATTPWSTPLMRTTWNSLMMTQRWMRWSTGKWNKKASLKVATIS